MKRGKARVGVLGCTDKSQKPSATCLYTADFKRCGGSHTRTMRLPRPSGIPYFACCRLSSARRSSVSSRASSSGINVDWQVITWPTLRDVAQYDVHRRPFCDISEASERKFIGIDDSGRLGNDGGARDAPERENAHWSGFG